MTAVGAEEQLDLVAGRTIHRQVYLCSTECEIGEPGAECLEQMRGGCSAFSFDPFRDGG